MWRFVIAIEFESDCKLHHPNQDNFIISVNTLVNRIDYLCCMKAKKKPIFEKRIFWDVNFELIDYEAKANFVIERVFERGDVEDIRQCRRYYGDEKVT